MAAVQNGRRRMKWRIMALYVAVKRPCGLLRTRPFRRAAVMPVIGLGDVWNYSRLTAMYRVRELTATALLRNDCENGLYIRIATGGLAVYSYYESQQ